MRVGDGGGWGGGGEGREEVKLFGVAGHLDQLGYGPRRGRATT